MMAAKNITGSTPCQSGLTATDSIVAVVNALLEKLLGRGHDQVHCMKDDMVFFIIILLDLEVPMLESFLDVCTEGADEAAPVR